jgi:DMSO/TMAO reductase YedYZ molybdopterin-dependent catalytic subunit
MRTHTHRSATATLLVIVCLLAAPHAMRGQAGATAAAAATAELKIGGAVETPLTLSIDDLKKMPRKKLSVVNPHEKKTEVYEGVAVQELLHRAGAPQGGQLRGAAMTLTVVAEGSDGYKAVFAIAELDPDFQDAEVIVADTVDGGPIGPNQGPLRIVAPHDKRPARWVRMLKSLTVVKAGG